MTGATLERELTQDAQAPTDSLLRSQLDQLKRMIELDTDPNVKVQLTALREQTRNHLAALLLREDRIFSDAMLNVISELRHGDEPRGVVTPEILDELLGL